MAPPHPFPAGWYRFRYGHELRPGRIVEAHFFGRPLVGFRSESGAAHVLDAHCPHLGAHLGGGRVRGEALECPFHGWQWGGDGRCAHVPFTDAPPPEARAGAHPVVERNGTVYFWHDTTGGPPTFDVPEVPETRRPDWRRGPVHRRVVRCHVLEPRENAVDTAHAPILHRRTFPTFSGTRPEVRAWREDAERLEFELHSVFDRRGKPFHSALAFELAGPGHLVMRMREPVEVLFLVPNTPVDEQRLVFTMQTWIRRSRLPGVDRVLARLVLGELVAGLREDYAIFARRRHVPDPPLSAADGPIRELRRWFAQFDPPPEPEREPTPADAPAPRIRKTLDA